VKHLMLLVGIVVGALVAAPGAVNAKSSQPNILIIWGDDIGQFNLSAYNMGVMGYKTPNIDSIAQQGAIFTDWYGQQSCTAGRAAFITGQSPIRTGLTKVGLPGAPEGMQDEDPTIATLLKAHGYMTGQFGKNHLGDRDEMLPTAHGFDEFFGNLYHLNAEEEPENPDYPKDPAFRKQFGPRGVLDCFADGRITDTGPLTKKRMETIDEEVTAKALDFMERAKNADKPFFIWWNSTRMHIWTHLKPASVGKTGLGIYPDGMVEHDGQVGELLAKLKELGLEDNTIIMYSTDNGAEMMSWPDGGTTMFRGEKNTNWEGGYRVPTVIKWPGVIKPGTVINEIGSHEDMLGNTRSTSTATTCCRPSRARPSGRAMSSSTGPTTGASQPCGTTSGRWCSSSSGVTASTSGKSHSSHCARRSCSTCAPIPSSGQTTRLWAMRDGASTTCSCSLRRRPTLGSGCRASRTSRRVRSPAASIWTV
jgi:hypothetical protein